MYSKRITAALPERFWPKVDKESSPSGCWLWTASIKTTGYGQIKSDDKMLLAHRVSYTLLRGPIPDGMSIDHLCKIRHCVNPDHMELVTPSENSRRGGIVTHCRQGHEFTVLNTYWRPDGHGRQCLTCIRRRTLSSKRRQ